MSTALTIALAVVALGGLVWLAWRSACRGGT
jgi:hypothetical protein